VADLLLECLPAVGVQHLANGRRADLGAFGVGLRARARFRILTQPDNDTDDTVDLQREAVDDDGRLTAQFELVQLLLRPLAGVIVEARVAASSISFSLAS
jgi:hypothetical protein